MKYSKSCWLFFTFFLWSQFSYSQASRYLKLSSIKFETPYFDKVEILKDSFPGPGDFHKVNIYNHKKLIYTLEDVLDSVGRAEGGLKNLSKSELFYLLKLNDDYIFVFFGFQFSCCLPKLFLLRVGRNGFSKVFDSEFGMNEIARSNGGSISVTGQSALSYGLIPADSSGKFVVTYAPTLIYRLTNSFELDSANTIKWNQENYVFRSFNADGDIWIAKPTWRAKPQFKPYVYKEKKADPPKK